MKVLVMDPTADAGLDWLRGAGYEVEIVYGVEGDALLEAVSDANGLIARSGTQVTAEAFEAVPDLVIVGRAGIGVDNVDIDIVTQHGIIVANALEGNVRAAAEYTVAVGFATTRLIPQAHARLKDGEWAKPDYLGDKVNGKTLDVVGLGRVGQEVAKKFSSLGMDIVAYDPHIGEECVDQLGAELVKFNACLPRVDPLTIHTSLTSETEGLISIDELETMESGYPVNCARGGVADEATFAETVNAGVIDGVAVDVFVDEPVSLDNPLLFVDDVVIVPHLGAPTSVAQENVAVLTADQIVVAFRDEPVINVFNAPSISESVFPRIQPYIGLTEIASKIAARLLDGRLNEAEVTYTGDIVAENIELIMAFASGGVLAPFEWQVSAVGVPQVIEERGIEVVESEFRQSDDFQSPMTIIVRSGDEGITVSGTLFTGEDLRTVRINGYRPDAIPHGQTLVACNYDKPGVIDFIGTVLGENDTSIAGIFNAHRAKAGGEALTVYNLDDNVPESVHEEFLANVRIIDADLITL